MGENLPITRKIFRIGNSKAVTLPKTWLDYYEKHEGMNIESVAMEVNRVLKISPLPLNASKKEKAGDEALGRSRS